MPPGAPKPGEQYHHKEGDLYRVVLLVEHSNDDEWMVVYEPMYENPNAPFFTRSLREWSAVVVWEGKETKRYLIKLGDVSHLTSIFQSIYFRYMNQQTMISVKIDKKLKLAAQKTAKDLGLPLGTVIVAFLKQLVRDRCVTLSLGGVAKDQVVKAVLQAEREVEEGRVFKGDLDDLARQLT